MVGVLAAVVLVVTSHSFGRAVPTNNYRPPVPTPALASGCYPLPRGAVLDLPHQVRWDGEVTSDGRRRRELRGQYDLVDRERAAAALAAAFTTVGFVEADREQDGAALRIELAHGQQRVGVVVTDLPRTDADSLVRGEFRLDLPVTDVASDAAMCDDPTVTKRWGDRRLGPDDWKP